MHSYSFSYPMYYHFTRLRSYFRPRPHVSEYFINRNFFFADSKNFQRVAYSNRICPPTRIRIHSSVQDSSVRHWGHASSAARLDPILMRHRTKKYPDSAVHDFGFLAYTNISTLKSELKGLQICIPNLPDTCGRKAHPQRKSCWYKNTRIRVNGGFKDPESWSRWGLILRSLSVTTSNIIIIRLQSCYIPFIVKWTSIDRSYEQFIVLTSYSVY